MKSNLIENLLSADTNELFAYELLRDSLLPEVIGTDSTILYWAGKKMARNINLANITDLVIFFEKANWGKLEIVKGKKDKQTWLLSGDSVTFRQNQVESADFNLEAGFIAETIQIQSGFTSETIIENQNNKSGISIIVQTDLKDPNSAEPTNQFHFESPTEND
ncbi:YslB family protein [Dellaglioa sp. BT-FLS60]